MPGSNGPCRFGIYRQLHQMVLERLGEGARVGIWSPPDSDYFEGVPPGLGAIVLAGLAAYGMLADALRDVRPVEQEPRGGERDPRRAGRARCSTPSSGRRRATCPRRR